MLHIRSARSFCLLVLAVLSLDTSLLRADESPVLAEPITAAPGLLDSKLTPPAAGAAAESAAESDAASADDAIAAEADAEATPAGSEPVRERYPNGSIKVERLVIQDQSGNYINHGPWKSFDQRGNVTGEGSYVNGERHGLWTRWYRAGEAELLNQAPYRDFAGPYISQATFENGKLQGKWTIYDAKQHKISELELVGGMRHGKATWWQANGAKMRDVDCRDGQVDGTLLEWSADGKLTTKDTYKMGRKLALKTLFHTSSQKKSEGMYLFAAQVVSKPDSWWDAQLATYTTQGKDERHGVQTTWYPSGQMQMQGEYRDDIQVGKFTWWFANGQKALEGSFKEGKQTGMWVWWHENGQKSIHGKYLAGDPSGRWTWWREDGKLTQALDMSHGASVASTPALPSEPAPMASKSAVPTSRLIRR